jgi:hypothetical protein
VFLDSVAPQRRLGSAHVENTLPRIAPPIIVMAGIALGTLALLLAFVVMTTEIHLFRATTQDMDFTGLVCETPLDHPDWQRGHPCDGAMNRQFVVGAGIALWGAGVMAASAVFAISRRSKRSAAKVTHNS